MTSAIDAGIAAIIILVLFERGTRALQRCGYSGIQFMAGWRWHVVLHGMGAFMHTIDRDGQHDHEQELGKEL